MMQDLLYTMLLAPFTLGGICLFTFVQQSKRNCSLGSLRRMEECARQDLEYRRLGLRYVPVFILSVQGGLSLLLLKH